MAFMLAIYLNLGHCGQRLGTTHLQWPITVLCHIILPARFQLEGWLILHSHGHTNTFTAAQLPWCPKVGVKASGG